MLKVARELLGLSQDLLASKLGLTKRAVQRVEGESLSLERQKLFVEFFQSQGVIIAAPEKQGIGWSIIETFSRSEAIAPGRLFRAARVGLDQSQEELSADANLGTMTIRRIEAAENTVEAETRQYLIDHLATKGAYLQPPKGRSGWGIRFTTIIDEPKARHPRVRVQDRKQKRSRDPET